MKLLAIDSSSDLCESSLTISTRTREEDMSEGMGFFLCRVDGCLEDTSDMFLSYKTIKTIRSYFFGSYFLLFAIYLFYMHIVYVYD
jgi:hypothetical protein